MLFFRLNNSLDFRRHWGKVGQGGEKTKAKHNVRFVPYAQSRKNVANQTVQIDRFRSEIAKMCLSGAYNFALFSLLIYCCIARSQYCFRTIFAEAAFSVCSEVTPPAFFARTPTPLLLLRSDTREKGL